jgi:hypothetical protein
MSMSHMNGFVYILIFAGLFLIGGAYSFWKQKISKGAVVLLALAGLMCFATGVMKLM